MGEVRRRVFEPSSNRDAKVEAGNCRLMSDAGTLVLREFDHRLELTEAMAVQFHDPRNHEKIRYEMVELLHEPLYS